VDADDVVGPARVEVEAVLGPGEGGAAELLGGGGLVGLHGGGGEVLHEALVGDVEDADALLGTDDEPVELLGEEHAVDGGLGVELEEVDTLDEVPDHDVAVGEPEAR